MTKKLPHPINPKKINNITCQSEACEISKHYQNGKEILKWSIKTIARPPKEILLAELAMVFIYATTLSFGLWASWEFYSKNPFQAIYIVASTSGGAVYFILLGVRQKTIYNYTIKTNCADLEYYLHYPDFASLLFKGIAIAVILLFLFVAIFTGSILFLIGPVAMACIAALKLLSWENPIHHEQSLPWDEYNFVTVDRKRLMIVTHRTDVTLGFEARFQHEVLFNKYLAFLYTALPPTTEFSEKAWKW
ncbi:permease [Pseudomonas syringae group sp. J248-6]|uniref:permease n=1 Tax=Pseudomonas syringae group sp. J248-6 TaxID=3079590 RepID=UPI002911E826|nr:permease [Pseudomonas syringae group sp. J248-6]MDU8541576.1 permease [Pseudomonas syringae group sp. J248-6]